MTNNTGSREHLLNMDLINTDADLCALSRLGKRITEEYGYKDIRIDYMIYDILKRVQKGDFTI